MTDISQKEAEALVRVLSLAENHPMWTDPQLRSMQEFREETYEAITTVREFLSANGIMTMHAMLQQAAAAFPGSDD